MITTQGVPTGAAYLSRLAAQPGLDLMVLCEVSPKREKETERILFERFGNRAPQAPPVADVCARHGIRMEKTTGCNSPAGLGVLREFKPDLILLAGSGIVKSEALAIPAHGTLNCHPGSLPRYRGCTCVEWAIYEDEPVGATCHFVTEEIDAGDILLKKTMPVYAGDSYVDVRLRMFGFQADLAGTCVRQLLADFDGTLARAEKFDWTKARYYKPIPAELMKDVLEKIESRRYAFASEKP